MVRNILGPGLRCHTLGMRYLTSLDRLIILMGVNRQEMASRQLLFC